MSRWLALAAKANEIPAPLPDTPTEPDTCGDMVVSSDVSLPEVASCRVLSGCRVEVSEFRNALDAAEERVAIIEFDGGLSRAEAEALTLQQHGSGILAALKRGDLTNNLTFALLRRLRVEASHD